MAVKVNIEKNFRDFSLKVDFIILSLYRILKLTVGLLFWEHPAAEKA